MPRDMKNLFITHTVFLMPYLLDLHKLLVVKFHLLISWLIRGVYWAGIITLIMNMLGVIGGIIVDEETRKINLSPNYALPFSIDFGYDVYIGLASVIYAAVFMCTLAFEHLIELQIQANDDSKVKEIDFKEPGVAKSVSSK